MSIITINTIIKEIIAIININILDAKWLIIEVSMEISSSMSIVLCCLSKFNFLCLYFSTNSLNVSGAVNNSLSKSSDSKDIGYALVLLYCAKMEHPMYLLNHQNSLKMLCWP